MSDTDMSYAAVLARKNEIMKASLGIDYDDFISSPIAFDYERMMRETGYTPRGHRPHPARDQGRQHAALRADAT